jgi:uncharacterized protein (TIGR03435 family)
MRNDVTAFALVIASLTSVLAQQPPSTAPAFDVVSIKRNTSQFGPGNVTGLVTWRPDGGVTMTNIPIGTIISRAYPGNLPGDMVGLPVWTRTEFYDVKATSSLPRATADDQVTMLRAMLADRFKLALHTELREVSVYDLVLARADGRLGPGMKPLDVDCAQIIAERTRAADAAREAGTPPAQIQRPDLNAPLPQCTLRTTSAFFRARGGRTERPGQPGDLLEAETTMDELASGLRFVILRPVVNKTGLAGSYGLTMNFDGMSGRGGPALSAADTEAPSIFTAIQEQLGLKLVASQAKRDTLVIDRLERPTEN